ncbi:MAG: deoxyribodipyrimidine photo-lyase [Methylibium sp.]|nr:deoxyribodipyrimidine photo-lyase [Methylibium sp.]
MQKSPQTKSLAGALVWLRRDLRAHDHAALNHALRAARQVWCAFVFDREILDPLPRSDRRVEFIRESLVDLDAQLRALGLASGAQGVGLIVRHGRAVEEIARLATTLHVQAVYANADYEPQARARDAQVRGALADAGIAFHAGKDQVVFDTDELLTAAGKPYGVFTPYKNAWLKKLEPFYLQAYPVERHASALAPLPAGERGGVPLLAEIGFETTNLSTLELPPGSAGAQALLEDFVDDERIDRYAEARDYPAVKGPSYLSVHLRFGTVSVRELAALAWDRMRAPSAKAARGAEVWLSELIWREFYQQVLHHHPRVVDASFKPEYDKIKWEHGKRADALFSAWCEGRTGYPLVDAAMAQINQTGYMHNRLRMVTASFLTKDLGVDWRRGERYFAEKLNDYDLAANNGGWQWAASTGCDAQPYFRIFNPVTQSEKFDPQGKFIRRYLPRLTALPDALLHAPWRAKPVELVAAGIELGRDYPQPVVEHDVARAKTLERYAVVKAAK